MGRGHPVLEAGGVSWPEISEPWSLVRLQDGGGLDSVLGSLRCAPDPPEGVRSCCLPGGMLSGGTGRGRRSPLRWGNGLDLSQQASLSPLPRGLSGCNGEVRGLVSSLQFFLCHLLMSIVISQHPDTRTPLRPCSNHNLSQITQALQTSLA